MHCNKGESNTAGLCPIYAHSSLYGSIVLYSNIKHIPSSFCFGIAAVSCSGSHEENSSAPNPTQKLSLIKNRMVSLHQPSKPGTTSLLPYILLISPSESRCKRDAGNHKHLLPESYDTVFLTGTRAMTQKGQCKLKGIPYFCIKQKQTNRKPQKPKQKTPNKASKPNRKEAQTTLHKRNLTPSPLNKPKKPKSNTAGKGKRKKKERKIKSSPSAH